ncbi:MAG: DNA (cytosine-5-)-methyltransferase [Alphaproteobacteria bacterium]
MILDKKFRFIDLFAGIGGFRIALDQLGGDCVFSSDYDKYSQLTYEANFGYKPFGDITHIDEKNIPVHDVLCAGFPCQPFSIAGVSKKNSLGRKHGFDDEKQGNLFFHIIRIINYHKPKILFLENVKNLKSHDKGNTWKVIAMELNKAGYYIFHKIIDGKYYVPQHRERLFIICFRKDLFVDIDFEFPPYPMKRLYELRDIVEKEVDKKYTLSDNLWNYLQQRKIKQQDKGNGFGYGLIDSTIEEYTRTLSARYYKDGSEILIVQQGSCPRKLTPRECAKLQGFPDDFIIAVSDTQAYKQFGNSVVVPAIKTTFEQVIKTVMEFEKGKARKISRDFFYFWENNCDATT